jgi:hypothetical protein
MHLPRSLKQRLQTRHLLLQFNRLGAGREVDVRFHAAPVLRGFQL